MNQFEQILQLPYVYLWLPMLAFALVAGAVYWMWRPAPAVLEPAAPTPATEAPPLAKKSKDLRGTSRRQGNTVEVHVAAPEKKKAPAIGSVLDRSMGGMRLALFHEVDIGSVVSIRPVHVNEMVPWVDVEIRSCKASTEIPGQFEVGCQYVKSPPYSIQLLFG
ncbi:MAG: hypothetical protein HY289_10680 [Planctomycetes bacterium]|nr:hypothetical protein [Planctomycetota bacterium]